jgi:hypothetical protein
MEIKKNMKEASHVVITVSGGVAEVHTCSLGVSVLIVDYDNLDCMSLDELDGETATWLQANDKEYWEKMRKRWEAQPNDPDAQTCN